MDTIAFFGKLELFHSVSFLVTCIVVNPWPGKDMVSLHMAVDLSKIRDILSRLTAGLWFQRKCYNNCCTLYWKDAVSSTWKISTGSSANYQKWSHFCFWVNMNEWSHCSLCSVMFGKEGKFKLKFCKKLIMIPGSLIWLMLDHEIDSAIPGLLAFGCKKPSHCSHSNKLVNVACLAFSFAALMYDRFWGLASVLATVFLSLLHYDTGKTHVQDGRRSVRPAAGWENVRFLCMAFRWSPLNPHQLNVVLISLRNAFSGWCISAHLFLRTMPVVVCSFVS